MGMVWVADLGEVEVVCFNDFYLQESIIDFQLQNFLAAESCWLRKIYS